jgi:tetratricopeptide (TPR) repeat protein
MPRADEQQKLQTAHSLHQKGELNEATKLYRELIEANPDNFYALHFLGLIEAHSGNMELAKRLMARSLSIQPPNIQFMENYATALYQTADYIGAIKLCRKGLKLNGASISLLYVNAVSLWKLGKLQDSLMQVDKLLLIQPNHVAAHNERGSVLAEMKNYQLAITSVEKAININPNYADAYLNKGHLCAILQNYDDSLLAYDRAVALQPNNADAYGGKAKVLLALGRLAEASIVIEKAIDLAPRGARFYRTLTEIKRLSPGDPHLHAMEELAREMPSLSADEQIDLGFALAKAFADNKNHEQSFRRLVEGNALKRKQLAYDEAAALGVLERTRRAFTADLMRGDRGRGDPSFVPVFILGMPRSGTTLVEQILASHPSVFGAGEITDFRDAIAELGGAAGGALHSPEAASRLPDEQLRRLGANYLGRIRNAAPAAARITNKTTENFRWIGLIHLALPNARIIHMRRDPIDTCLSCFSLLFDDSLPYTFDLRELGRYYRAYEATMAHWRDALPANVMLEVQYEEVVADLEGQARRVVAHCGLEWDSRCLDFHQTVRPVRTASVAQVRQPIYKSSVGRWRAYEAFLGPLLAELGVSTASDGV